ncbi:putative bifunctional diguanylate cyclase/phosphodiesterase [Terrarubrum flagellatum]|uniref:putative bifunctional diguanylate cyclase/phosphodiesterase n=1 Tax=Terrirubrum flagellatum TaxID=2895980 RepID=UPI0031453B26
MKRRALSNDLADGELAPSFIDPASRKGDKSAPRSPFGAAVFDFLSVPSNPDLLKAQYRAFSQQVPLMYVILMVSTWMLAITHLGEAPAWLALGFPIFMTVASAVRIIHWWKSRNVTPTAEIARKALKRTNRLSSIIACMFTCWALALFYTGDAYDKSHVAFYMAITVIACIFCLMHLRPAAFKVAAIVNGSFVVFFSLTGQKTLVATAINLAVVSVAMLAILLINYRDFVRMIEAQARAQALSDENFRLANVDSLTDIPNRRAFFSELKTAFASVADSRRRVAIGMLDLDGFKPVNDLHGHAAGDRLLFEIARRFEAICQSERVYLARLGGDEFALIVNDIASDADLFSFGERLCAAAKAPVALPDATVQISGSVGFAVYPEMAASAEELFDHADYALYQGKRLRRGSVTLFSAAHGAEIHRDARIEQALRFADLDSEMAIAFQPIFDIENDVLLGFEALARWTSPLLGEVSPGQFIPVAERAGLISGLTQSLLRKALTIAAGWPSGLRLSFNLSAHDMGTPEAVLGIVSVIMKSGFEGGRLDFEITETALARDIQQVQSSIQMLRNIGCGISLDDFGSGYSSFTRLHALPLTKIKVDRSFVSKLHERPASYKIVKSLLALSRDMELECVVEGVETEQEMATLRELGCKIVQGNLYSPPLRERDLQNFIASRAVTRAVA